MQREYTFHDPFEISPNSLLIRAFLNFPMPATCVWDIGTGCGKVLIESYFRFPGAKLIGFDPDERAHVYFNNNRQRHGVPAEALELVTDAIQQADLSALARPDAIYLGCPSTTDDETMARLWEALLPGGVMTGSMGHRQGYDNPEWFAKMERLKVWAVQYGGSLNEYTTKIPLTESQQRLVFTRGRDFMVDSTYERLEWVVKKPA